jgi:hypothetical protein
MSTRTKGRGCDGKQRHDTKAKALAQLRSLQRNYAARGIVVYRCRHCDGWHVGHRSRRRHQR